MIGSHNCTALGACVLLVLVCATTGAAAPVSPAIGDPAQICQATARSALAQCSTSVGQSQIVCYMQTGAACSSSDAAIVNARVALSNEVFSACASDAVVQDAGFGPLLTRGALRDQLVESCLGEIDTLSARTYGGPQGSILATSDATLDGCLFAAASQSSIMLGDHLDIYGQCIESQQAGGGCDSGVAAADIDASITIVEQLIDAVCPATLLPDTIGIDVAEYVARAAAQARCMVSATHGSTAPFDLDCGPVTPPARGVATQYIIDDLSAARCGDGSPYAFWVELAPAGHPVDNVSVYLQGGGVCVLEGQCQAVANGAPGLLTAMDDGFPTQGILGDSSANPFANHTKVFLPYCTQDVFIGGGATQEFSPSLTVERFGGRNVRSALAIARNLIWGEMKETSEDGYQPDDLDVVFSGNSAGGFGAAYNYHWVLDDLRWERTIGVPSASLALDNEQGTGILLIGALVQGLWDARTIQPSYCQTIDCAVGPVLGAATATRLESGKQKLLWVSNQVDDVQASTTNFADGVAWTNAVRNSYCADAGQPNVQYFLGANPNNTHGVLSSDDTYLTLFAGGVSLTDWLRFGSSNQDAIEEGTLVADIPGVAPFACALTEHDTDWDGIANSSDNCLYDANPAQIDADDDGIGNRCDADFNNDCIVNALDLGLFRSQFFGNNPVFDLNGDGIVATVDLGLLKYYFFSPPGPSGTANICSVERPTG